MRNVFLRYCHRPVLIYYCHYYLLRLMTKYYRTMTNTLRFLAHSDVRCYVVATSDDFVRHRFHPHIKWWTTTYQLDRRHHRHRYYEYYRYQSILFHYYVFDFLALS